MLISITINPLCNNFYITRLHGQGTDQLANKKITFRKEIASLNGVSITGSTLTLDSTATTSQIFSIQAIQECSYKSIKYCKGYM